MKNVVGLIVALLLLGWLLSYWQAILGAVLVGALVYAAVLGGRSWWQQRADARRRESEHQERLAARAQQQHEQYLAGDEAGVYGIFRPADPDRRRRLIRRLPSSPSEWRARR